MDRTKTIVFVGGFSKPNGLVGGVYTDSRLLLESRVGEVVNFETIDSTMRSLPLPHLGVRAWDAWRRVRQLRRRLRAGAVDGVLIFSPFAGIGLLEKGVMCALARRHRARVVLRFVSEIREVRTARRLSAAFIKWVLRQCDVVLCQTALAARNLATLYPCDESKLVVLGNWIDAGGYATAAADRAHRAPPARPVVLFMGWMEQAKGVFELVDAARRLRQRGLDFRLVMCGSGGQYDALVEQCGQDPLAGTVEFRGWVDEPKKRAALAEADLLVLPSYHEGLPNSLVEAMAAGLPVVTTPVGGIPCLVESGRNGLLVPPRDAEKLADAIETLLRDEPLRRKMGAANRRQIENEHDLDHLWPRIATILTGEAIDATAVDGSVKHHAQLV
jgi:glycosyltransferase involved in cell wall biosynthesis